MKRAILILVALLWCNVSYAAGYKISLLEKNEYGIVFKITIPWEGDPFKWKNTFRKTRETSIQHCNTYNKDTYVFWSQYKGKYARDKEGKFYDHKYGLEHLFFGIIQDLKYATIGPSPIRARYFCAENAQEAYGYLERYDDLFKKKFKTRMHMQSMLYSKINDDPFNFKNLDDTDATLNVSLSQDSAISQYLSGRKLEKIEGVWVYQSGGRVIIIYKSNNSYYSKVIWSQQVQSGSTEYRNIFRGSSYYFNAIKPCTYNDVDSYGKITKTYHVECTSNLVLKDENKIVDTVTYPPEYTGPNRPVHLFRLWPENFNSHNAKFEKKKEEEKKKKPKQSPDDDKVVAAASGSGFFVSNAGHIVTNHHVIDECKVVKVNFKGDEIEAKILAIDKTNDLAILKAKINPSKVYSVSNEDVTLLQDVIVAGFPLGKKISAAIKTSKGSVSALAGFGDNFSNFQTDATINQGNSGGPVMDQKGNVVGVAVALMPVESGQNIFFAVKSSTLKTFANANGITFLPPNNREMSNAELGQLITEGTLFLECWMTIAKIKQIIAQEENRKAFYSEHK